jgi:PAS domain S-box-containing protein
MLTAPHVDPFTTLQTVLDNLPGMVGYWDTHLRNVFANQAYAKWFGVEPELLRGTHLRDLLGEAGYRNNQPYIEAALRGEKQVFEREIPSPGGENPRHALAEYLPDISGGVVHGFFVQVSDITPVKQAHRALLLSEAKLRGLYELSPLGIGMCRIDGRFVEANAALCRICGYTEDELKALDYWALTPTHYAPDEAKHLTEILATGFFGPYEKEYIHKDGHLVPVQLNGMLLRSDTGEPFIWAMVEDITARRAQLLELTQAKESAEMANAAKSQFLAAMSHEIRTPLNAVLGMLDLLEGTPLSHLQREYTAKTAGASKALLTLLNDIMDFSKVQANKLELENQPFRLDQLTQELSDILSAIVGSKPVEVIYDMDAALPAVILGDALRLKQVLVNLGSNAVKFTHSGTVVIGFRCLHSNEARGLIEFWVQDSGIGIATQDQARIFDAFAQAEVSTTRRFGGTGLGLAISRRLVECMGGRLEVASALGQGSTFRFTLPLPEVPVAPPALARAPRAVRPDLRCLVVDDNPLFCHLMREMLCACAMQVDTVTSGAQALARIRSRRARDLPPYEVVLLDWQMPGMDGWETARQIRDMVPQGPEPAPQLIMVTANGRHLLSQRTQREKSMLDGILSKPVSAGMLLDVLERAEPGESAPLEEDSRTSVRRRLDGMRLLLVEDNPSNQQVAEGLLRRQGALISLAANGELGVAAVAAARPPFDAVLMDLHMPILDGFEATRQIREQLGQHDLPVIALSANAAPEDRQASLAAGLNDHVGKPFDVAELCRVLIQHTGWTGRTVNSTPKGPPAATKHNMTTPPCAHHYSDSIDVAGALVWVGNDINIYRKFLDSFLADIASSANQLQSNLEQSKQDDAARLMHTLKGLAKTAGAKHLSSFAKLAEARLRQGLSTEQARALVTQTGVEIDIATRAVQEVQRKFDLELGP